MSIDNPKWEIRDKFGTLATHTSKMGVEVWLKSVQGLLEQPIRVVEIDATDVSADFQVRNRLV